MKMNESFFGKYSVFCVFGSVVGCVLVPLISQLVQKQSMECMILLIIFLTLTAAHLKKGSNDGSHSKLLFSRDYEKRKYTANVNSNHKKQKQNSNNQKNHQQQQQKHTDQEYHQKYERLKVLEMEKRNEQKRLKKQKKREERLKRKEEEIKKQKETEEKSKERRRKYHKENSRQCVFNSSFNSTIVNNYEKYCCSDYRTSNQTPRKYRSLSQDEGQAPIYRHSYSTRQNIPRFNNNTRKFRASHYHNNSSCLTQVRSTSDVLSISCSNNLSTSCSSLSSISSNGSTSPPPPSPNALIGVGIGVSPWNTKPSRLLSDSALKRDLTNENAKLEHRHELNPSWSLTGDNIKEEPIYDQQHLQQKFYQNRSARNNKILSCNIDSSSLFCSTQDKDRGSATVENTRSAGEYSLFGSHQFGNAFIKSTII